MELRKLLLVAAGFIGVCFGGIWYMDYYPSAAPGAPLPTEFEVKQTYMSKLPFVPTTLEIVADGHYYGQVKKRVVSIATSFYFDDQSGTRAADASKELIAAVTTVDVTDGADRHIGS